MRRKAVVTSLILLLSLSALFANGEAETQETKETLDKNATETTEEHRNSALETTGKFADQITGIFFQNLLIGHDNLKRNVLPRIILALISFDIFLSGMLMVVQKRHLDAEFFFNLFMIVITLLLLNNLPGIVNAIRQGFTSAGSIAGGGSVKTVCNPSSVVPVFNKIEGRLWHVIEGNFNFISEMEKPLAHIDMWLGLFLKTLVLDIVLVIVDLVLIFMFVFVMVNIILWNIEFAYLLVLATFLLPFALFPPTKFLSTGVWPALAGQGVKLFCASFIITVSNRIYGGLLNMSLGENAASFADNSLAIVPFVTLAAIVYCYFILRGPDIAKAMIVGQPTMDSPGTHMILSTGSKGLSAFLLTRSLIGGIGAHGSSRQTVNNYYKASSYRGVSEAQSASRRS